MITIKTTWKRASVDLVEYFTDVSASKALEQKAVYEVNGLQPGDSYTIELSGQAEAWRSGYEPKEVPDVDR